MVAGSVCRRRIPLVRAVPDSVLVLEQWNKVSLAVEGAVWVVGLDCVLATRCMSEETHLVVS
jgi:hypothetical protein